jgi:protein phosphatase
VTHPAGRKVVLLGDLVDRGPKTPDVLRLAMDAVDSGSALCVQGNHEQKLLRKLKGRDVKVSAGMQHSLAQLGMEGADFVERATAFLDRLLSHYVLDDGKLVVAHAGLKEELQGRASRVVRDFALYGDTTGETDEYGLPVRRNWGAEYRGKATVVYGHTPVAAPSWLNRTINVDTGCVFGGSLTALRYPELELVSVPAAQTYFESPKPFLDMHATVAAPSESERADDLLDLDDVLGGRAIETGLRGNVTIRPEQASAALEVMSRFAADPRWLIYLPLTMSPSETSREAGLLEHPAEAFAYFRKQGVSRVICQEKHMGSRAVAVVCRDEEVARRRFGVGEAAGMCYTRTGRRFFEHSELDTQLLAKVRAALDASDFWARLQTDWVCLDCELMPWSAKAQELLRQQYAAVGAAACAALGEATDAIDQAAARGADVVELRARQHERAGNAADFVQAYRRFSWPVHSVAELRLAPFHVLATEGQVHADKSHPWHMEHIAEVCRVGGPLLKETASRAVELADPASEAAATAWWQQLTVSGGEGMVVKPLDFTARGASGLVQPALKCRGREYLRLIYGPDYTMPEHLERLRARGLSAKRALALREFALGIEALERFVRREPLYRVHECVFGVLALESEPVDPRL